MRRFRWSDGPNDFAAPVPRDGATLRSPIVDAAPRRPGRDQLQQPVLLCRIAQNGEDGEWSAEDPDGNELRVETAQAGGFEVWSIPEEETADALHRRVAPRQINDRAQDPYDAIRAYQKLLDKTYGK